jgi:hypothetical protein
MPEIRYNTSHHAGPDASSRINNRLKNSGGNRAPTIVKNGDGARRTFSNVHPAAGHVPVRDVRDRNIKQTAKDKP